MTLNEAKSLLYVYYDVVEQAASGSGQGSAMTSFIGSRNQVSDPTGAQGMRLAAFRETRLLGALGIKVGDIERALRKLNERQQTWLWHRYFVCGSEATAAKHLSIARLGARSLDMVSLSCFVIALGFPLSD